MEQPREAMTYGKALIVLNLNNGFTEEKLKKAYRLLARKYHPDNYMQATKEERLDAEEKMKEVNEAYEFLYKWSKRDANTTYNNTVSQKKDNDINLIRESFKKKMQAFYKDAKLKDEKLISDIKEVFKTYVDILSAKNEQSCFENVFTHFLERVKAVYLSYQEQFYQNNNIDSKDVTDELKYDCSIDEFYEQLCKIKEKYNREALFEKRLEDECAKYYNYDGYNSRIEFAIKRAQGDARIFARDLGYGEEKIKNYISTMHSHIEESFMEQAAMEKVIESLKEEVSIVDDNAIHAAYNELVRNNADAKGLFLIRENARALRNLINAYKKKQSFIKQNKSALYFMCEKTLNSFKQAMLDYNKLSDIESMKKAIDIYRAFISCYRLIVDQKLDYLAVSLLDLLSFRDFSNDNRIIEVLFKSLNGRLYIEATEDYCNYMKRFNALLLEDGRYYMSTIGADDAKELIPIEYDDIDRHYISFDEFMDKAKFKGIRASGTFFQPITILYSYDDYILYLNKSEKYNIVFAQVLKQCHEAIETEQYRNKEFMKDEVLRMVQEKNSDVLVTNSNILLDTYRELTKSSEVSTPRGVLRYATSLLNKLFNDNKKKKISDDDKTLADTMYERVVTSFVEAMETYSDELDFDKMGQYVDIFKEFIFCYYLISEQRLDISVAPLLADLSFREINDDRQILNSVRDAYLGLENRIFINIDRGTNTFMPIVNVLSTDKDGRCLMSGIDDSGVKQLYTVSCEEIASHYITLDEFVASATYVARYGEKGKTYYVMLYSYKDYMVCLNEAGNVVVCDKVSLRNFKTADEAIPYKDKDFLKAEIAKMIQENLFNYSEPGIPNSNGLKR